MSNHYGCSDDGFTDTIMKSLAAGTVQVHLLSNEIFITIVLGKHIPLQKRNKKPRQVAKFEAQPWLTKAEFDNGSRRVKRVLCKVWIFCLWLTQMSVFSETQRSTFSSTQGKEPWPSTQLNSCDFMYGNDENLTRFYLLEHVYSVNAVTRVCFVFKRKWHPFVTFHSLP